MPAPPSDGHHRGRGPEQRRHHLETDPPQSAFGYTVADVAAPVHMALSAGLQSALHEVAPQTVGSGRPISHTSSYAQDGCCDYVFIAPTELTDIEVCPQWRQPARGNPPYVDVGAPMSRQ